MNDLVARVHRRSIESWYLAERGEPERLHPAWQSPFALNIGIASAAERARRIHLAGAIWLKNDDLRFAGQLWISDLASGTTWAFRRCREPGGKHLYLGPIHRVLVSRGRPLFRYPLRYSESDDPEQDRLLLTMAPPPG